MTVKPAVEGHVDDCSVIDYEMVRSPLEPEALRILLQRFADGGTKQAVKMEVGNASTVCQRFQRKILIEVSLDVYKHRQQFLYFARGWLILLNAYTHLSCCRHVIAYEPRRTITRLKAMFLTILAVGRMRRALTRPSLPASRYRR